MYSGNMAKLLTGKGELNKKKKGLVYTRQDMAEI